jgi:hypothetical protein
MDVKLPDGTVIRGVPDGMSKADLTAKLAKNGYDVSKLAPPMTPQQKAVQDKFAGDRASNKAVLDEWRASGSPQLSTAPKTDAEFNKTRAVLAALDYEKQQGRPAPEMPVPQQRKPTQHDIDQSRRLAMPDRTWRDDNLLGNAFGVPDAAMGVLSSLATGLVAPTAGIVQSAFNGKDPKENVNRIAEGMSYQPATGTGAQMLRGIGKAAAPLAAIPSTQLLQTTQAIGSGATALRGLAGPSAAAANAADAALVAGAPKLTAGTLADLVRAPKPAGMAGVGAAETAEATLRAQRFANMRAPMKPTKGILSRSIDDVQFEREAAKRPEGKALDQRYADLNRGMEQHMDELVEQTGATASSARETGKTVTAALEAKKAAKKAEIKQAYKEAKEAGDMAEMVDIKPLANWLDENRSAASTATIVKSIESEVERLSGGTGRLSINDMEQLRKLTGSLAEKGTPNGSYGTAAIKLIDETTAGKGGPKYQQARRQFENYANEFKNRDAVAKLLRTKRGTKDRAVAYEDVADSILFEGSLDDMKHTFRVLEAHPKGTAPEIVAAGQQAAKELRGAAAAKLKDRMFSNAGADSSGRVVGSEAQINRIVKELDRDGKLEALFGKKGAAEIRDTALVAKDLYSTPKGTVNSSNTASAMEKILDRMAGTFGGTPVVGHAIKYGAKKLESRNMTKKVNAALEPTPPPNPRTLGDMAGDQ